jgi:putative protease
MSRKRPEILAPVADWEMCQAAVHNGADAVYIGAPRFNARGRTHDFSPEELKQFIDYCHLYGVKVFLACNVLVFERELEEIEALLRDILPLGPDAIIVQDLGLVRLIRRLAPRQTVHASTQMTVTSNEAIELTEGLGIERYVLGREVSIKEMERIRAQTARELEVFVHGALCVSYSGQCLTSESSGGRSANRGQCAQSCRYPYDLVVDGAARDMGEKRYLVSPQDLCGLEDVGRLVAAGIDSFKIEGRLKSPEYVASTVRNYREVSENGGGERGAEERLRELGLTFTRGRFNGWLDGVNHQRLVDARFARPQGNYLGSVRAVTPDGIELESDAVLAPGDGVVFHDFKAAREVGGVVFSARPAGANRLRIRLGREFSTAGITAGMEVFHNSSSSLEKELRLSYSDKTRQRRVAVRGALTGAAGDALQFSLSDDCGHTVEASSAEPTQAAKSAPLTCDSAEEELGAMGGTPFTLTAFDYAVTGSIFVHNKVLKELRREACEKLKAARTAVPSHALASPEALSAWKSGIYAGIEAISPPALPSLNVLIRDESQAAALSGRRVGTVYLDFEFNKDCERALGELRGMGFRVGIATTRILKSGELGHLKYIERLKPDAILVRNLGALSYFKGSDIPLVGDFSLNAANGLTCEWLLSKGLALLSPSYDLNQRQLLDLAEAGFAPRFEITVHQYMPAFHMEHCVFAAFLSNGTSFRDCGRPCEKHRVELRDRDGILHPLKPDAECRNTMFQGRPQSASRIIPELSARGVRAFRIEALFESPRELAAKIEAYAAVLFDGTAPESVFSRLGIVERYGVTEGQLFNERTYRDRKKEYLAVLQ